MSECPRCGMEVTRRRDVTRTLLTFDAEQSGGGTYFEINGKLHGFSPASAAAIVSAGRVQTGVQREVTDDGEVVVTPVYTDVDEALKIHRCPGRVIL